MGQVTVFAPSVSLYPTYRDGGCAWWTGTSMPVPFVAGEALLFLSMVDCDRDCVAACIEAAVHPVVPHLEPRGRVDLYGAVLAASGP